MYMYSILLNNLPEVEYFQIWHLSKNADVTQSAAPTVEVAHGLEAARLGALQNKLFC